MIGPFSVGEASLAVEGQLRGDGSTMFGSVSTDSRTLGSNSLFVALKGERFDGHDSLDDAFQKGACAAIVSREVQTSSPTIKVSDTREALARLGHANRLKFDGQVIGMTGSVGKTSVKNMLADILSEVALTWRTPSNQNNEIGVPLSLLALKADHHFAVIEMGARSLGDIAYLGNWVRPNIAILLNARESHIGEFGSYENIVEAKGEILINLAPEGVAIVNADDPAIETWRQRSSSGRWVEYALTNRDAHFYAEGIQLFSDKSHFRVISRDNLFEPVDFVLPVAGEHMVSNALAAISAGVSLGIDMKSIQSGLAKVKSAEVRQERHALSNNLMLIDDSYNASPSSVKAAIDVLALHEGPHLLALGEMAELGPYASSAHKEIADYAKGRGVDRLYLISPYADQMCATFGEGAKAFESIESLYAAISLESQGVILVKGSRMAHMERLVDLLVEGGAGDAV